MATTTLPKSAQAPNPSYTQTPSGFTYNGNSGNAGEAVSAPTLAAAQAQWAKQYPSQQQKATTPSTSTAQNPLTPSYIPTPPQANATTYSAANAGSQGYNPTSIGNTAQYTNSYDPAQATSELNQAAAVQNSGQNAQLMQMLAAQGISPGSSAATGAQSQLSAQQGAALDPQLAAVQQYAAGLQQQSGMANAGALNTTNQLNAGYGNTASQFGAGAANTAALSNQAAQNTAGQYNAGASNTMTSQNLQDLLQQQQYNASAATTAGTNQAQMQNNDWLAQLQAELGIQGQGLATSGSLAGSQANQAVPIQPSFLSQVTSGLSGAASTASPFSSRSAAGPSLMGDTSGANFQSSNGYGY